MATKNEQREKQIQNCMKTLGLTREEAIEMLEEDDDIERGVTFDWDLSPEEHKKAMKNANTGTKKAPKEAKEKKPRKENPTKRLIINELATFLTENEEISANLVEITNPERVVRMVIGDDVFEVTLSQKRKPKDGKTAKPDPIPVAYIGGKQFS